MLQKVLQFFLSAYITDMIVSNTAQEEISHKNKRPEKVYFYKPACRNKRKEYPVNPSQRYHSSNATSLFSNYSEIELVFWQFNNLSKQL